MGRENGAGSAGRVPRSPRGRALPPQALPERADGHPPANGLHLVNIYSRFIVQFFPMLNRPLVNPPETPFGPPESFTPQEKDDLIAFLRIL